MTDVSQVPPEEGNLAAEAERYGFPIEDYATLNRRERAMVKARWSRTMRAEAKKIGVAQDTYLAMTDDQRGQTRAEAKLRKASERSEEDEEEELPVFTAGDEVPATEADPAQRSGMTIGPIRLRDENQDLRSNKQLRTLRDLYEKFTIGDGAHVIRVERMQPKVWQTIPVAGYLGEIREVLSESQFQRYFGGREYELQVYGPNPKGAHDTMTGLPKVQALTDPITITVPMLPPNLHVLPAAKIDPQEATMTQPSFNPFAGTAPATPADAQMHKTTTEFAWRSMEAAQLEKAAAERSRDEALRRAQDNGTGANKAVIDMLHKQHDDAMGMLKKEQEAKEKAHDERLKEERERAAALRKDLDDLKDKMNGAGGSQNAVVEGIRAVMPQRNASDEVARITESFREDITDLKESHQTALNGLKQRNDDELRRAEERHKEELGRSRSRSDDMETHYKKLLEDERQKRIDRERELKEQIEERTKAERDVTETRVRETKERYEDRLKDLERAHTREMNSSRESMDTRMATKEATLQMEINNLKERLEDTKSDLERAREEAEKANDPVEVMEKQDKLAKQLGYKKKDDEPPKGWDLLAATAGQGIGMAFQNMDKWVPDMVESMRKKPAAAQPGQPGDAGQPNLRVLQGGQSRRQRAVAWATEGAIPTAGPPPNIPAEQGVPPAQQPQQPAAQAQPPAQPQQPSPQQQPEQQQEAPPATNPLSRIFSDDAIENFRQNIEQAINVGVPPDVFAQQLVQRFPQPSKMLVEVYKSDDFVGYVKNLRGGDQSAVMRRDGRAWVEQLWGAIAKMHQAS